MIRILGDVCFADGYFDRGQGVGTSIINGADPFKYFYRNNKDFWIGNFECVCSENQREHFVITPEALGAVKHIDLYGIANNHIMQIGEDGFNDTITFLDHKGIKYAGSNDQKSICFEHEGHTVGFMAFSMRPDNFSEKPLYWHLPELSDIEREIESQRNCDFRIAFIHWGYEFINRPNIEQRQMAHWLIDSGIDLVVGMHPHVAQGAEVYKGKYIFYSLGNTVFNMPWEPTKYGLLVNVDLSGTVERVWSDYIKIESDFFPRIVKDVPENFSRGYLDSLLAQTIENEQYFALVRKYTDEYTSVNRRSIAKRMMKMPIREKVALIADFAKRRLYRK